MPKLLHRKERGGVCVREGESEGGGYFEDLDPSGGFE